MALLQPKLSFKVAQRQILTPGLMQMVSVLALNKLELKEMIDAEMAENPVLEEIDENVPLLDEVARQEIEHDRSIELRAAERSPRRRKIPSTKSTSDRTFRTTSIPASAPQQF